MLHELSRKAAKLPMPWTPCVTSAWCPICPKTGTRLLIHLKHIKHYMGCDTALNSGGNELSDFKRQLCFDQKRCLGRQLTRCWDTAMQCDSTKSNITLISDRNEHNWVSYCWLLTRYKNINSLLTFSAFRSLTVGRGALVVDIVLMESCFPGITI